MRAQDIKNLITDGWRVGYTKTSSGRTENGFAIKGRLGRQLNARWIEGLYKRGEINIDTDQSLFIEPKLNNPESGGFLGLPYSSEERAEIKKLNTLRNNIGAYGRICFKAVATAKS